MGPLLHGFADELLKLAAFSGQQEEPEPYDGGSQVAEVLEQSQGARAKTGLKSGPPIPTASAPKKSCGPLTTPTQLISAMGAEEA